MAWNRPPSEYATCNEWMSWYDDLKREFGRDEANRQFSKFFKNNDYGAQECLSEKKFERWANRKGLVGLEDADWWDFGIGKTIKRAVIIVVVIIAIYVFLKYVLPLLKNMKMKSQLQ